jgi:hypothetical protein
MASRKRDDLLAATVEQCIVGDKQCAVPRSNERIEGSIDFPFGTGIQDSNLLPDGASGGLKVAQLWLGFRAIAIDKNGNCDP